MANTITHKLIKEEALRRGWSVCFFGKNDVYLYISDNRGKSSFFRGSQPSLNSANGSDIARDKYQTIRFINHLGYKTPASLETDSLSELKTFLLEHKRIVIKPLDSDKSQGVTVGIDRIDQLKDALSLAQQFSSRMTVIAQRQIEGKLYRLFVLNQKIVAVSERRAAMIEGDGVSTVEGLINKFNANPLRGEGSQFSLQKVPLDDVVSYIGKESLDKVLEKGCTMRIAAIESVSAGGSSRSIYDEPHPTWANFVSHVTKELGLFVAGFDVITSNITLPISDAYVPLLEVNSMPGFKIHEYPTSGEPVHLAPMLLDATIGLSEK